MVKKMQSSNYTSLLQLFETEYTLFLSKQKEYEFNVQIINEKLVLDMNQVGSSSNIPQTIKCIFMISNEKPSVVINDSFFDYSENILEKYITDYIRDEIIKQNVFSNNEELIKAADMFGLSAGDISNKKLINERYKIAIKKLHPDKWASNNDPVLSKNATSAVIQMTEARDVLLKNIERMQS
jgi:hypothetical protein